MKKIEGVGGVTPDGLKYSQMTSTEEKVNDLIDAINELRRDLDGHYHPLEAQVAMMPESQPTPSVPDSEEGK